VYDVTASNVAKIDGVDAATPGSLAILKNIGKWLIMTPWHDLVRTNVDPFTGIGPGQQESVAPASTMASTTAAKVPAAAYSMPTSTHGHGNYIGSPQTVTAQNVAKVDGIDAAPIGSLAQQTSTGWWVVVTPAGAVVYTKVDPFLGSAPASTDTTAPAATTTLPVPTAPVQPATSVPESTTTIQPQPTTQTLNGIVAPPNSSAEMVVSVTYSYSNGGYTTMLTFTIPAVPLSQSQIDGINSSNQSTYQSTLKLEQEIRGLGTGSTSDPYQVPPGDVPALLPWYGPAFYSMPGYGVYYLPDANSVMNYNLAVQGEYSRENTAYVTFAPSGQVEYPAGYSGPTNG
jgi:hypothetical protein